MEDHHVDRPGVEVRQRMELTGTNCSIGLIISHASYYAVTAYEALSHAWRTVRFDGSATSVKDIINSRNFKSRFRRPGDYGAGPPPVPISNTVVKSCSADGTTSQGVGE